MDMRLRRWSGGLGALVLLGCSGAAPTTHGSSVGGAGGFSAGGAAKGGTGAVGAAGSLGVGGDASSTNGGSAGAVSGAAGESSAPQGPPLEVGPFHVSGSGSHNGTVLQYTLNFNGGDAWIIAEGDELTLNQPAPFISGLIRLPKTSPLGDTWICPGPDATWVAVASEEPTCTGLSCDFELRMPHPSRLSCSPGAGRLALGPAVPGINPTATLSSSAPDLNGLSLAFQAAQLERNPGANPTFFYAYAASARVQLHAEFDSTANPPTSGTVSTSWNLANAFVARIDGDATTGSVTPAALYCSSSGSYEISSTAPVTHTVSLEGMSERATCPGEPLQQPLLARLNGWH